MKRAYVELSFNAGSGRNGKGVARLTSANLYVRIQENGYNLFSEIGGIVKHVTCVKFPGRDTEYSIKFNLRSDGRVYTAGLERD